ncbi:Gfo/Idh/MocA family oxidoreductase [Streptomyces sp. RG80]|uniref:Gfo/Idh/MocA family protein n=1 Tax=Streptomyces sp. RG80 TaxID=3157340 RepID=UPI0033902886
MEAMWMRCNPANRKVVDLVTSGAIGEPRTLHADFGLAGPFAPTHRLRAPELGGGALLDLGVYPVNLAHLLLGVPCAVQAWSHPTPEGVDANAGILLGYPDGALAALSCGIVTGSPCRAALAGDKGRIELPAPFFRPDHITLYEGEGAEAGFDLIDVPYEGTGYVHQAREVMRCLRTGETESPMMPWQATLEVMDVLDQVRGQGITADVSRR